MLVARVRVEAAEDSRRLPERGLPLRARRRTVGALRAAARSRELPWIRQGLCWLLEHRPPEPDRLALCHRDFHGLNVLVDEDGVTGILDWDGLLIADPAFDVANTIMLLTIPGRHLAGDLSELGMDVAAAGTDPGLGAETYLAAYRSRGALDETNLAYYGALRCWTVLVRGSLGATNYRHPLVVRDLVAFIQEVAGIRVVVPGAGA